MLLLVHVEIDRVGDEIRANTTVVEKGVALRGRSIPDDGFSPRPGAAEEVEKAFLDPLRAAAELPVHIRGAQTGRLLPVFDLPYALGHRKGRVFRGARVDADRAAVR